MEFSVWARGAGRDGGSQSGPTIGRLKPRDMHVAMGSAVYGTPHMMSNLTSLTLFHITLDTFAMRNHTCLILIGSSTLKIVTNLLQDVGIRYNQTQIHVDWRNEAGFEFELSKLNGFDLVQLQNKILNFSFGHWFTSSGP